MVGGMGAIFWLIIAVVLIVIEGATTQLVCLWFAIGSLFAMLAAFISAPVWMQLLIFLISSVAVLIVGRPVLMEKLRNRRVATNADRVIGQIGIVLETIDNVAQTGRVSANGLDWTARCEYDVVVPKGSRVFVRAIDGVKLIVQPVEPPQQPRPPMGPGM